ncbi:13706_t:CDS:2, partial [Racocetra persica]
RLFCGQSFWCWKGIRQEKLQFVNDSNELLINSSFIHTDIYIIAEENENQFALKYTDESAETESNPMKNTNPVNTDSEDISADMESISVEDNHDVNSDIDTEPLDN